MGKVIYAFKACSNLIGVKGRALKLSGLTGMSHLRNESRGGFISLLVFKMNIRATCRNWRSILEKKRSGFSLFGWDYSCTQLRVRRRGCGKMNPQTAEFVPKMRQGSSALFE